MPSPAAAADHHALFDEDTDEDLDDDSEVDEYDATLASSDDDDDDHPRNPSAKPGPGNPVKLEPSTIAAVQVKKGLAIQVTPISSVAPAAAESEASGASEAKLQRIEERKELEAVSGGRADDSRRLFQKLWTDEDEIAILQGFYEFTFQRGTTHHAHQHDTGPFYDQIRTRLQLDFNKNQLVEKLRRLKKKYKNNMSRMGARKDFAFKSPHDRTTFEISRKIWSSSVGRTDDDDGHAHVFDKNAQRMRRRRRKRTVAVAAAMDAPAATAVPVVTAVPVEVKAVPSLTTTTMKTMPVTVTPTTVASPSFVNSNSVEETVRSCFSPLLKELVNSAITGPLTPGIGGGEPLTFSSMPLSFGGSFGNLPLGSHEKTAAIAEKWRKQQILELEVYYKRIELVQEQIKLTLKELRSLER